MGISKPPVAFIHVAALLMQFTFTGLPLLLKIRCGQSSCSLFIGITRGCHFGKIADSESFGGDNLMLLYKPKSRFLLVSGFSVVILMVAAIVLVQPKLYALWKVDNRFLRYLPKDFCKPKSIAVAQAVTAPLVIFYFSVFPSHFY